VPGVENTHTLYRVMISNGLCTGKIGKKGIIR
jgi:hypothetical protein